MLDTPYTAVGWPKVSQEDQDVILELLCHLLTPFGIHRSTHIKRSKGKRRRLSKEKDSEENQPALDLAAYVDIGLSCVSKGLQAMSSEKETAPTAGEEAAEPKQQDDPADMSRYSMIFVARSGQSTSFHSHFPQMVAVASDSQPSRPSIRLIGFSKSCEERLAACLGIPRVSVVAIREGAPQVKGLLDFVRDHVSPVLINWHQEAQVAIYRETKIDAVQTKVGTAKIKKPRAS